MKQYSQIQRDIGMGWAQGFADHPSAHGTNQQNISGDVNA